MLLIAIGCLLLSGQASPVSAAAGEREGRPSRSQTDRLAVWVAPDGSDAATGSRSDPLATLQRAQRRVRQLRRASPDASITVKIRAGTYRLRRPLRLTAADSGASGQPVIWRAAGKRKPLISGSRRIEGWTRWPADPEIWRARVPAGATSRDLYVSGERAQRARTDSYPAGFRPTWNGGGAGSGIEYLPTIEPNGLNPAGWGDPTSWRHPADIEAVLLTQWTQMRGPLADVQAPEGGDPGLISMQQPAWQNANLFRDKDTGAPGIWSFWQVSWFENALAFLDEPGEWYLDTHTDWLYYYPNSWERPNGERFELPRLQQLIVGAGSAAKPIHDIRFSGLRFANTTWLAPSSADGYVSDQGGFRITGDDNEPNSIGHNPDDVPTPASVSFRYGRDLSFRASEFDNLGAVGLALGTGAKGNAVRYNSFTDTGSSAITLSGISARDHHPQAGGQRSADNTIANNMISSIGATYRDAPAIYAGFAARTRIIENTISNVPWSGIAVGWGWGLLDPPGFPGLPGASQHEWGNWGAPTPNRDSLIARNTSSG